MKNEHENLRDENTNSIISMSKKNKSPNSESECVGKYDKMMII